jgi:hypothetical protein
MQEAVDASLTSAYQTTSHDHTGRLASWAAFQGVPAVTLAIPETGSDLDLLMADNLGQVVEAAVEAAP